MTLEEQIIDLQIKVGNLEIQTNRLLTLVEQQYQCMDLLRQNQQLIDAKLEVLYAVLYASNSSNSSYVAGQIDRNSGR